jgi:hypothetical protein
MSLDLTPLVSRLPTNTDALFYSTMGCGNDMIVGQVGQIGQAGHGAVPEPSTIIGILIGGLGFLTSRVVKMLRKKGAEAAETTFGDNHPFASIVSIIDKSVRG